MQNQELTYKAIYTKLAKRTEKYAADVRNVFLNRMGEIAKLCEGIEIPDGKVFHFNDYPEIATDVQKQLRAMYSELYQCVRGDITREWYYANDDVDRLVKAMFGKEAAEQPHFAKYFQRNKQAMDAFFARKQDGLDLSQRIWRIVGEGKEELELALDLGLGEGMDAGELSREVRKYLLEPEKLFRRVRNKHGELVLSKAAKAYHPGQGVYRSSYKNAMRVTRTETNMAYRTADITRWQQLPFVTGYEVKTSKSHKERMPMGDICDDLAGVYPKGFMFKGWHPHCLCYIVPKLCTDKELEELTQRILDGTEDEFTPAGMVEDVPNQFKEWVAENTERIEAAQSLPYFLRDNYPNGDITKAGKWMQQIANEAGMGNMAQLVAKSELELAKFANVQAMSQEAWEASSNFVPAGSEELELLLGAKAGSPFNSVYTLGDKATMEAILKQAGKGVDAFGSWLSKEELAELERVATMAKYATKQEGKLVTAMGRKELEYALAGGKTAQFGQSLRFGTNYAKAAKGVLAAEEEQVLVVVRTPAGSRYVQTMAGEAQQAVMLPNTRYKLLGTTEKTIVQAGGKTAKLVQYELELVDDGSKFVEQLLADNAKVQKELAAFGKAKKAAENVIKAAQKGKYELLGIDTLELEEMITLGKATTAEVKAKTQELAKAMAAAKKAALEEAKSQPNLWQLAQEFGEADAQGFMANWQKHMAKSSIYTTPQLFLKKVIEKELYYAKLNPTKYKTTGKFIEYMEKLQVQYEAKVQLASIQSEVDAVVAFASTCKSNAKIHSMVSELLQATSGTQVDMAAVKSRLATAQAEMDRLTKERLKLLKKKTGGSGYDIEQFYTPSESTKLLQLRGEYEKALAAAGGKEREWSVIDAMQRLADYTAQLGEKYAAMQPKLENVDGLTEAEVLRMIRSYFARKPMNPTAPSEPYGIWSTGHGGTNWFGHESQCRALAKKIASFGGNVTAEELSTITDFTRSSNWICDYLYGASKVSLITDPKVRHEVEQLLAEFKATINHAIENMPRFNGITYRGLNIYPQAIADPTKDAFWESIMQAWNSKDKVWTMVAPTSTTTSIHTADNFADGVVHAFKGQRVIMKIHGKTGVDIHEVGYFGKGESEITFRAGSKFRLLKAPYKCSSAQGLGRKGDWCVEIEEIVD